VYQVLVNQITATMGKVRRAPRKIYNRSSQSAMTDPEPSEVEVYIHDALSRAHECMWGHAGEKQCLRRRG